MSNSEITKSFDARYTTARTGQSRPVALVNGTQSLRACA
nr:MAG TPA: hypothetical protein [Caudoviricetes sp.]